MGLLALPGGGIGPEITSATATVLGVAARRLELRLDLVEGVAGHESLRRHGTTVRPGLLDMAREADGLILGPMATLGFQDGPRGEINPSMFFRKVSTCSRTSGRPAPTLVCRGV